MTYTLDLRNATRLTEYSEMNRQGLGIGRVNDAAPTVTASCVHGVSILRCKIVDGEQK